jgi:dihydrofolate synthase/folylpolyglutamate synthase
MAKAFSGSASVYAWLQTFIDLERSRTAKDFRLDRMRRLAELAGRPEKSLAHLHVAGSKGKGSVSRLAACALAASGRRTAIYASPHVSDFRERIALADGFFPEAVYASAGDAVRRTAEALAAQDAGAAEASGFAAAGPTFFELSTLLFFECARLGGAEAAVLETGLGGRLDATNITLPEAAVITPIELEHTDILGSTLAEIAGEKAGIIKPKRPVLVAAQAPEALAVLRRTAAERGAPFYYFPDFAEVEDVRVAAEGTSATISLAPEFGLERPLRVKLRLAGKIQADNAALAAAAVLKAWPGIDAAALEAGLSAAVLPARFELLSADPPVVVDGAHTVRSVGIAADTFRALYGDGGCLLFACAADKPASALAAALAPYFSRVFVTAPGGLKAGDAAAAGAAFAAAGRAGTVITDTDAAVAAALAAAADSGSPLLCVGSFYLAAAVRRRYGF